ncbi:hypothetical protein [Lysobacter gummosus]|uniref:hypothetical protein n=1 Tax=Lysobacter gummosus TaxID=262324 RepID=UPI00362F017B
MCDGQGHDGTPKRSGGDGGKHTPWRDEGGQARRDSGSRSRSFCRCRCCSPFEKGGRGFSFSL